MIKFIDINSSNVFNGTKPYVFWFDLGQSTNIQYIKQICFVSPKENVNVSITENPIFKLVDTNKLDLSKNREGLDINTISSYTVNSLGFLYSENVYVHMIYILTISDCAGEYIEDFNIDGEVFSVGADFYMEDERLLVNLKNFGIEIPAQIQKAIYDSNVHEPYTDNILMNRKWKELLLEYFHIVACKGSYNSLIDSLKWFEWGGLVKMQEFWKYNNYDKQWLLGTDLLSVTVDELQNEFKNYAKTTYIGVYAALKKLVKDDDEVQYEDHFNANMGYLEEWQGGYHSAFTNLSLHGNDINYENRVLQIGSAEGTNKLDNVSMDEEYTSGETEGAWFRRVVKKGVKIIDENNPKIEDVCMQWSKRDISLKMTLLGNYFSTYFMPIHLDTLHSTIEDLVYSNNFKIVHGEDIYRCDTVSHTDSIICNIKNNSIYTMKDHTCYVYPDTPLSKQYEYEIEAVDDWSKFIENTNILAMGVSTEKREIGTTKEEDAKTYVANMFSGIGALIPTTLTIENVDKNRFVEKIVLYDNDSKDFVIDTHIYTPSEDKNIIIDANILIRTTGEHKLRFEVTTNTGELLVREITITVLDNSYQPITLYTVERLKYDDIVRDGSLLNVYTCNDFMHSQHRNINIPNSSDTFEVTRYSQFLPYRVDTKKNAFGLNHMIKINTTEVSNILVNNKETSIDDLKQLLTVSGYIVDEFTAGDSGEISNYLVAVNPNFYVEHDKTIYYEGDTHIVTTNEDVHIRVYQQYSKMLNIELSCLEEGAELDCYITDTTLNRRSTLNFEYEDGRFTCNFNLSTLVFLSQSNILPLKLEFRVKKSTGTYELLNKEITIFNIDYDTELDTTQFINITPVSREDTNSIISENRLFPIFHTLKPIEDDYTIVDEQMVVAVPNIPMTLKNKNITCTWTFINESTGKTLLFKPTKYTVDSDLDTILKEEVVDDLPVNQPIIYTIGDTVHKNTSLPVGYYSIKLEYSLDGEVIDSSILKNAFRKI